MKYTDPSGHGTTSGSDRVDDNADFYEDMEYGVDYDSLGGIPADEGNGETINSGTPDFIVTPNGTVLPTNENIDLVDTNIPLIRVELVPNT